MDCSSTLIDSELEDMSVRQMRRYGRWSNQWVSIERTQHKCKKCAKFFFNEAALKHYNCESSIRKKKHPHCGKGINCTDNLEKHLENDGERSAHGWCSYQTHWTLEGTWVVEAPLKYMVLTFRKTINSNSKRDVLQSLKDVVHTMRSVIEGQSRANEETVRWYLSVNMNFCKSTSPGAKTDPAVTFLPEVLKSIDTHEFNYHFNAGYNQIVEQIDEYQRSGGDWVVDYLQHLDLGSCFL